ncbi:uncharacterized protein PV07_00685 [Cladophialophora immunda]|uniref:FAD/NAD(P)-binding domain-containing protein n=1 Tax=Cladophialophora immunda TaxID=569365 RepID=A0A0D2CVG9_9EURO|nr:uncharacterized protein PV07_00685 [Cladophialophora immunda]KIW33870.1 hypothetical protein PV07_00685 [Cladophialophora immunda]
MTPSIVFEAEPGSARLMECNVAAKPLVVDGGIGHKTGVAMVHLPEETNSNQQTIVTDPDQQLPHLTISEDYTVSEEPLGTIRPVRVISIGAGASGINLAYQFTKNMQNSTLNIYEKNPAVGGTWYENRYPGCKCDIPSHNYQFSWEPNPNWAEVFSPAQEIKDYLQHCVDKYDLAKYIHLSHKVICAEWNEERGIWNVKIEDTANQLIFTDWCHYLINAGGILNNWKWPSIPGLHEYQGKLVHSANWPSAWDYSNLKVAVIGNGSTGIQIVPEMQKTVKQLVHIIRSPTWVTPGAASRYPSLRGGSMPDVFTEEQKEHFRNEPESYLAFRKQVEREINSKFQMLINGSAKAAEVRQAAYDSMISLLGPEGARKYAEKIIPSFPVGCRRITPGVGYLESFTKENVRIITDASISRVDKTGLVMSDGEHIEVDAIVCATGFDVSFSPRFPVIGRDKISLSDVWSKNIPFAYLSMTIPKFPNYFVFLGPNAPISHGSILTITEQCSKYVMQLITKAQTENIKAYDVKQAACDDFLTHIHHFMPRTAWAAKCRSWFKNGTVDGPILAIHPGSRIHWFHSLERPKFEDFDYTYWTNNRFSYLGNGFSTREMDGGDDTWFLEHPEAAYLYY